MCLVGVWWGVTTAAPERAGTPIHPARLDILSIVMCRLLESKSCAEKVQHKTVLKQLRWSRPSTNSETQGSNPKSVSEGGVQEADKICTVRINSIIREAKPYQRGISKGQIVVAQSTFGYVHQRREDVPLTCPSAKSVRRWRSSPV